MNTKEWKAGLKTRQDVRYAASCRAHAARQAFIAARLSPESLNAATDSAWFAECQGNAQAALDCAASESLEGHRPETVRLAHAVSEFIRLDKESRDLPEARESQEAEDALDAWFPPPANVQAELDAEAAEHDRLYKLRCARLADVGSGYGMNVAEGD